MVSKLLSRYYFLLCYMGLNNRNIHNKKILYILILRYVFVVLGKIPQNSPVVPLRPHLLFNLKRMSLKYG